MKRHRWTPAEIEQIVRRYPDEPGRAIAADLGVPVNGVHAKAKKLGLRKSKAFLESNFSGRLQPGSQIGINGRFKPGSVPPNKGTRRPGWGPGRMRETQFKKGHLSGRAAQVIKPIGAERLTKDGILQRKVNNDLPFMRRWKAVHAIVWEAAHGPIPHGHIVLFKDRDRTNRALENLELITWRENMLRNTVHNLPKPLPQLVQLRGALNRKINRATRHEKQDGRYSQSPVRSARAPRR